MRINVIGSGYMGKQICSLFDVLGYDVLIWQNTKENLENHINDQKKRIEKILNIRATGSFKIENSLSNFEKSFTIETVKENIDIKKKIISSLNYNENIFSNTSSIKLSEIGNNINGFHFMNPITVKIIELCKKTNFSHDLLNTITESLSKVSYKDYDSAILDLLKIFKEDPTWENGKAKDQLLQLFESLGHDNPIVLKGRRKLSSIVFS